MIAEGIEIEEGTVTNYARHQSRILRGTVFILIAFFFSLSTTVQAETIFFDDFEAYSPGTFPGSGEWSIFYNGAGNAEQYIDNLQASSGVQSFRSMGGGSSTCWAAALSNSVSLPPKVRLAAKVRIDSIVPCGCSVMQAQVGLWRSDDSMNAGLIYFGCDGNIYAQTQTGHPTPGVNSVLLTSYSAGTWYDVKIDYDYDLKRFNVYVDDILRGEALPIIDDLTGRMPDAVRVGAGHGSNPIAWFDDIQVTDTTEECVTPPSDMISWWTGDGDANDIIGINDGALQSGATFAEGKVDQAFSFDGADDFVQIPKVSAWDFGTSSFSITSWFKSGTAGAYRNLVRYDTGFLPSGYWGVRFEPSGKLQFIIGDTARTAFSIATTDSYNDNEWHFVAAVRDAAAGKLKIYVDGSSSAAEAWDGGTNVAGAEEAYPAIGRCGSRDIEHFAGLIDEVGVCNRALSAEEIDEIYNAGSAGRCEPCFTPPSDMVSWWKAEDNAFDMIGTNDGALQSGATFAEGKVDQAFSFDGVDDYVDIPDSPSLAITGSITIDGWFYADTVVNGAPIFNRRTPASVGGVSLEISSNGSSTYNQMSFYVYIAGGHWEQLATPAYSITAGRWYHVAATYDGAMMRLYLDGAEAASRNVNGAINNPGSPMVWIGRNIASGSAFDGLIDELSVYRRALSAEEIAAIYAAGSSGMCVPSDTTPDAFTFVDQTGAALNTVAESNTITVSGINATVDISVTGGEYSIDGGDYTSLLGAVTNGQTVSVRVLSASTYSATTDATLTIGTVSDTFSVTTLNVIPVSGSITGNVTWTNDNIYVVNNVEVGGGATLTVEPGTIIKLGSDQYIEVRGALNAPGTDGLGQIYFTSSRDDSVGGDTNGDGAVTSPAPGDWVAFFIYEGGSISLDHSVVRYSGQSWGGSRAIWKQGNSGTLSVTNSVISNNLGYGIQLSGNNPANLISGNTINSNTHTGVYLGSAGATTISYNQFIENGLYGLYSAGGAPSISGNTFTGNTGYGLYITGTVIPTAVTGNTFSGSGTGPIAMDANGSGTLIDDTNNLNGGSLHVAGGSMSANRRWSSPHTYYVTSQFVINAGITLDIDPGTVVKFGSSRFIEIWGTLNSLGTAAAGQIYFTSDRDDAVGGDTNDDGAATSPAPGDWVAFFVYGSGSISLDHSVVRYSGHSWGGSRAIWKMQTPGTLNVTNSVISNNLGYGIQLEDNNLPNIVVGNTISSNTTGGVYLSASAGATTVSNNQFTGNGSYGVLSSGSTPAISGNTFTGNTGYGLYVTGTVIPTAVTGNTFSGSGTGPIAMDANGSGTLIDNTNNLNGRGLHVEGGTMTVSRTWASPHPYYITSGIIINASVTHTIQSGTIVKIGSGQHIQVYGALNAPGTAGAGQIYFTSYRDDSLGGDSNGDGTSTTPAPGDWAAFFVYGGGSLSLDHSVVRYAGYANSGRHAVWKMNDPGNLSVTNSVISDNAGIGIRLTGNSQTNLIGGNTINANAGAGVYLDNANGLNNIFSNTITGNNPGIYSSASNPVIGGSAGNGNDIYGNTGFGVQNISAITLSARYNWWGDASGPYHATTNPSGTGNAVSDYVDYGNYLGVSALTNVSNVSVTPPMKDFGELIAGQTSAPQTFTITNNGTADLGIGTISITGADPAAFIMVDGTDTCSSQTLLPFGACSIQVMFVFDPGEKSAFLNIPSNDPESPSLVQLSGKGVECTPPPSGMVSWWSGDGHPFDLTGDNEGTMVNGATYAAGKVGRAFSFDGVDDYVTIPDSPELDMTSEITIDAWIYRRDAVHSGLLNKGAIGSNGVYDIAIYNDKFYFRLNGAALNMPSNASIPVEVWTHVAGTYDGETARIYVNGVLDASQPYAGPIAADNNSLRIGLYGSPTVYFNGLLDELEIFNRALEAEEIAEIYNAGSAGKCEPCFSPPSDMVSWWKGDGDANDTIGTNQGTFMGAENYNAGTVGSAFNFDGDTDNFVSIPDSAGLNPAGAFTVNGWFYLDPATNTNNMATLVSKWDSGYAPGWGLDFNDRTGDGFSKTLRASVRSAAGVYIDARLDNAVTSGNWYHVAAVFDPESDPRLKLYVNGVHVASSTGIVDGAGANAFNVRIGASYWWETYGVASDRLNGMADEVQFFSRALSAEEIAAIYAAGDAGICVPSDTIPDGFTFIDQVDVALNNVIESNEITVSGIDAAADISITGGKYSINGGTYTLAAGTVSNGDTITVRQNSSGSYSTTTDAILTIGGVSDTFSVTTLAAVAGITVGPESIPDFQSINVGSLSAARQVTITSSGTAPLVISAIETAGADAGMFHVSADGSNPCVSLTPALAPGTNCTIAVRFRPDSEGEKTAILRISSDAPDTPRQLVLTGRGTITPVFSDVPEGNQFNDYINALYYNGITVGYGDGTYRSSAAGTRYAAAAFIIRAKYGETFSYGSVPYFTDVPAGHPFFRYIQKMREEGITMGCTATKYCPEHNATRQEMAAFIVRALYGEAFGYSLSPHFSDVPGTNQFFKYIQEMYENGIARGYGGGTYRPAATVTRGEMAAFMARAFLGME